MWPYFEQFGQPLKTRLCSHSQLHHPDRQKDITYRHSSGPQGARLKLCARFHLEADRCPNKTGFTLFGNRIHFKFVDIETASCVSVTKNLQRFSSIWVNSRAGGWSNYVPMLLSSAD